MKRFLVTGGAGFIGSSISNKLLGNGFSVRVFDNEFRGSKKRLSQNKRLNFLKGDIRDIKKVREATRDIDVIIHLAYINGTKYFYEKPDLVLDVGVKGMLNVLDAAKENRVKELYLASSSEVYQNPPTIPTPENVPLSIPDALNPRYSYGGGKIISELLALHLGSTFLKKVVIFRPHNVYGPNMGYEHVIPELISRVIKLKKKSNSIKLPIQGDGSSTRSFIFIDDFTEAIVNLINKGVHKNIYNIGTDEEISIKKLVDLISTVSATEIKIVKGFQPEGGVQRRCPDVSKMKKLGYTPKTDLNAGLRKTYLWYNNDLNNHGKSKTSN